MVRATITRPPVKQADREALLDQLLRRARSRYCWNEPSRTWLKKGIGFEYEYTMDGKAYSPLIIAQKDCE